MADTDEKLENAIEDDTPDFEDTPQTDSDDSQAQAAEDGAEHEGDAAVDDSAEMDSDSAEDSDSTADDKDADAEDADAEGADAEDSEKSDEISRKIDELLAEDNEKNLTPQMRRLLQREKEQSRRVEKSIEGTKTNPTWFLWIMCGLMILGLVWIVVYYLTGASWPIPKIGNWNLLIGFGIMLVGFLMTMWWH
ncbi:cell division protein CrgA [Pseudoscardovia suis]